MEYTSLTSLCRICLQEGATFPIFDKSEIEDTIHSKLSLCFQHEKVEDIAGLPRHICVICNTTLETLCQFIHKFRESCKILENGLLIVKKENYIPCTDIQTEVEIDIKGIKAETDNYDDGIDNYEESLPLPLKLKKQVKKEPVKKEPRSRKPQCESSNQTNKIASSLLEGNFSWNGDKWCMKIGHTILKKVVSNKETKPRPQTKIQLPLIRKTVTEKLCDLCGNVFRSNARLSYHKRKVHFRQPVKCPKCPRVCASDYYLMRHMKRTHETNRDFICSACGHGFAFKGELTTHFRKVHDKLSQPPRIYSCKFCDKTYKCSKSIIIHERSVHTGQRPAECSVCKSRFYHEDYLKEHMRLHTGETPFKCPICGRGYAQRGNMKSHLRIHRISELDAITLSKMKPNYLKLLKV